MTLFNTSNRSRDKVITQRPPEAEAATTQPARGSRRSNFAKVAEIAGRRAEAIEHMQAKERSQIADMRERGCQDWDGFKHRFDELADFQHGFMSLFDSPEQAEQASKVMRAIDVLTDGQGIPAGIPIDQFLSGVKPVPMGTIPYKVKEGYESEEDDATL